jgi:predicted aspartyl protease
VLHRFRSTDGLVRVPVVVLAPRARARLRFVVDPGTARTIVAERRAVHLGLTRAVATRRSRVSSVLGAEEGWVVRVDSLEALGWCRQDFDVACHRFAEGADVDGLLGADFFAELVLTINYAASTVDLAAPQPA